MKFGCFQLSLLLPLASAKLGATPHAKYQPRTRKLHGSDPTIRFVSNPNLGRCEGDCDTDTDCDGDLICFERDNYDAVPGCSGGSLDYSQSDYCIRKTDDISNPIDPKDPPVTFISNPLKLGICEGDCDVNSDCGGDLLCFQRDANEDVPGCHGGSSDGSLTDYCVERSHLWWDDNLDNSLEECSNGQGLCEMCQHCSTDDDCIGAFVCFERKGVFPVPDCFGWEFSVATFSGGACVHPKYELKIETSIPLNECAGDCDDDNDCYGDLVCFHREKDEKTPVPGCVGGENDSTKTDYCVFSPFVSDYIGRYDSLWGADDLYISTLFPLTECQGDCDEDSDCRFDFLVCFQRDAYEAVPGCDDGDQDGSKTDYCVYP